MKKKTLAADVAAVILLSGCNGNPNGTPSEQSPQESSAVTDVSSSLDQTSAESGPSLSSSSAESTVTENSSTESTGTTNPVS